MRPASRSEAETNIPYKLQSAWIFFFDVFTQIVTESSESIAGKYSRFEMNSHLM